MGFRAPYVTACIARNMHNLCGTTYALLRQRALTRRAAAAAAAAAAALPDTSEASHASTATSLVAPSPMPSARRMMV